MRILVVGAGAVGGTFGGRLAAAGGDVTFLVRPRRAKQIARNGLVVRSPRGDLTLLVRTVQAGALRGPYDVVLVCCKAFDLEEAVQAFAPAVGPATVMLPLLNGMAGLDVLGARFGPGRVLGGQCQIAASLEPDGTIRHLGELQALSFGERDGTLSPRVQAVQEALAGCGGKVSETIMQDMWEKWVFLSSVTCQIGMMLAEEKDVVEFGDGTFAEGLGGEAEGIASAAGHPQRPDVAARMKGAIADAVGTFTVSMLRDLQRGKRSEADHIVGDLISRGTPSGTRRLRIAYRNLRRH